jgi:hypothetical protein
MSKVRDRALDLARKHGIENADKLSNQEIFALVKDKTGEKVEDAKVVDVKAVTVVKPEVKEGAAGAQFAIVVQPAPLYVMPSPATTGAGVPAMALAFAAWVQPWAIGLAMGALFVAPLLRAVSILR